MRAAILKFVALVLFIANISFALALAAWTYDPGPDPQSPMGKKLIDLVAEIPNAPEISLQVDGRQRFRPAYGPVYWRMRLAPNTVKILFIGQDATHIAEAANRTATAGFGGRGQDLAAYFGVSESAGFMNTFAFTINGQYATAKSPFVRKSEEGWVSDQGSLIDNQFWLVSHDPQSPVNQWRNQLIEWVIQNNPKSLKLIVAFGRAANDAMGAFFIHAKGNALAKLHEQATRVQVPETKRVSAGGNNQFDVPLDKEGKDLYRKFEGDLDYANETEQSKAQASFRDNLPSYLQEMIFTQGGPQKNGLVDIAQLNGYDIRQLSTPTSNGPTVSLRGLTLSDGETLQRDIFFVQLPHPTALSMTEMDYPKKLKEYEEKLEVYARDLALYEAAQRNPSPNGPEIKKPRKPVKPMNASEMVARDLEVLQPLKRNDSNPDGPFYIEADEGRSNLYAQDQPYKYGREDIGPEFYDFGTPASRMVSVSSAVRMNFKVSRLPENPEEKKRDYGHVIIFGARETASFDPDQLSNMTHAQPNENSFDANEELFTARPRGNLRAVFDAGPGEKFAKIIKEELAKVSADLYRSKDGTTWNKDLKTHREMPIANFNIKSHPMHADFGHYRGSFAQPKVVLLADPVGFDDIMTSRALTGSRGQLLHGFFKDLGVGENYLVIKTVPFSMDGASDAEWAVVRSLTKNYRKEIFKALLAEHPPDLLITDGKIASEEIAELVGDQNIPIVKIDRAAGAAGLLGAAVQVSRTSVLGVVRASGVAANIPRAHLPYFSRLWEGTSGDRVVSAAGAQAGLSLAEVAPLWAWGQKYKVPEPQQNKIDLLKQKIDQYKLLRPNEEIKDALERLQIKPGLS